MFNSKWFRKGFFSLVLLGCEIEAASPAFSGDHPWLTGPLLTPSARVVKKGHILVEPYFFHTWVTGRYDNNWTVQEIPLLRQIIASSQVKIGLGEKLDISTNFKGIVNTIEKRTSVGFGDLPIVFDYQLYNDGKHSAKLGLGELFPAGKFQKLEPGKFGTDSFGQGSFLTLIGLTFARLFNFGNDHYLNVRFHTLGTIPVPVDVKGINAYGGDPTTRGRVFPGLGLDILLAGEYTLTQNWALALDIVGQFAGSNRFKGTTIVPVGFPPSALYSLAPAIEYNWNSHIGLIVGSWFSLKGRNSNRFASFVTALNIFY